jgi:hypothetical protein
VSPVNLPRIRGRVGRRALVLGAAGLVAAATLTACGFNYPTDRINNLTAGVDYRDGSVDILNAVVVSNEANSGTFVATFVNGSSTERITLQSVSGDNTAIANTQATPFALEPNTLRNLATQGGIPVSGTFVLGQFVNLSFSFDDGETADLSVPVVHADGQWAGLDISTPAPSPSPSVPTTSPATSPTTSPTASPTASPS